MPQAPADIEGLASCTRLGRGAGYTEEAACWVTQELGARMLGHGGLLRKLQPECTGIPKLVARRFFLRDMTGAGSVSVSSVHGGWDMEAA